jgi:hypothetical protein
VTHLAEDGVVWVMEEPPGRCELCGAVKETRPYGPNGEQVCFPCGMKDEKAMQRAFGALLSGETTDPEESR